MVSALLITLREGLEAALIVGIVLGYLGKIGDRKSMSSAWLGVVAAIAASGLLAAVMRWIGAELQTPLEQIFEGSTMLLAVLILTWMIFWMRYQARTIKGDLEYKIRSALSGGQGWGIFALAFLSVFREGVETALFLSANAFAANGAETFTGALLGLAIAAAAGVLIYTYSVRLDLRLFFGITSILLVIFAAGLLVNSIHEFQEIGALPILTGIAWDTKGLLDSESGAGAILHSLIGYDDQPSLLQVTFYIGYWVIIAQAIRWWSQRVATRLIQEHA